MKPFLQEPLSRDERLLMTTTSLMVYGDKNAWKRILKNGMVTYNSIETTKGEKLAKVQKPLNALEVFQIMENVAKRIDESTNAENKAE